MPRPSSGARRPISRSKLTLSPVPLLGCGLEAGRDDDDNTIVTAWVEWLHMMGDPGSASMRWSSKPKIVSQVKS